MAHATKTARPLVRLNRRKRVKTADGGSKLVGRRVASAPRFRASLRPGAVLILLSGPFRGKRVVLLKLLESGLLLVTGPFTFNGVPLKRVNPRYVIATSTNVFEMNKAGGSACKAAVDKVLEGISEDAFGRTREDRKRERLARKQRKHSPDSMFVDDHAARGEEAMTPEQLEALKRRQDAVDAALKAHIGADPLLAQYLKTRFTLRNGMYPHKLKF